MDKLDDSMRINTGVGALLGFVQAAEALSEASRLSLLPEKERPMNDLMHQWYAVPGYGGVPKSPEDIRSHHVLDAKGELQCVCETLEIADHIAAQHNIWLSYQKHRIEREASIERSGTG